MNLIRRIDEQRLDDAMQRIERLERIVENLSAPEWDRPGVACDSYSSQSKLGKTACKNCGIGYRFHGFPK